MAEYNFGKNAPKIHKIRAKVPQKSRNFAKIPQKWQVLHFFRGENPQKAHFSPCLQKKQKNGCVMRLTFTKKPRFSLGEFI